jgi:hypothetical protein
MKYPVLHGKEHGEYELELGRMFCKMMLMVEYPSPPGTHHPGRFSRWDSTSGDLKSNQALSESRQFYLGTAVSLYNRNWPASSVVSLVLEAALYRREAIYIDRCV